MNAFSTHDPSKSELNIKLKVKISSTAYFDFAFHIVNFVSCKNYRKRLFQQ